MKTLVIIYAFGFPFALFAQNDTTHELINPGNYENQTQNIQTDTAKNCLTMKNGKVIIMQNGKATPLKQDTILINGTRIKINGMVVKKDGSKMMMKENECFNWEGIRMVKMNGQKKVAVNK